MIELDTIYNEDCLTGMSKIKDKSIDMILCDLPYGCLNKKNKAAKWDCVIPFDKLWRQYERIIKDNGAILLFADGMFLAKLMESNAKMWRYNIVWNKEHPTGFLNANRMPLRCHEEICVFYKKLPTYNPQFTYGKENHPGGYSRGRKNSCYGDIKSHAYKSNIKPNQKFPKSIITFRKVCSSKVVHPTQKPVDLARWLIRTYSDKGQVILDNCIGSGTTAIAALLENRHFLGFEIQENFYAIAQERVRKTKTLLSLSY